MLLSKQGFLFQDAVVSGECNELSVFGGCDSVARFNIISMVSPVSSHTASSQTRFEKLTAHESQKVKERESSGKRVIEQYSINAHLKLTSE